MKVIVKAKSPDNPDEASFELVTADQNVVDFLVDLEQRTITKVTVVDDSVDAWKQAVADGQTQLGYKAWIAEL